MPEFEMRKHDMKPKDILLQWVDAFNRSDVESITKLYAETAINHQVANEPVVGKHNVGKMCGFEYVSLGI